MAWIVLILSAVLEAVWATALGMSHGLTKPLPSLVFFIATTLSMIGLAWAMKHIPLSVAYSVWVGLGAGLTVAYAMATGNESVSVLKVVFLLGLIGSVVGLKFVPTEPGGRSPVTDSHEAMTTTGGEQRAAITRQDPAHPRSGGRSPRRRWPRGRGR
ncbi:MAG TPA: multidrug efflux SMR transporter [Propionibacterium sp.]|nr:multidrug efflux SMR transporter [Propionibacterium sp.]